MVTSTWFISKLVGHVWGFGRMVPIFNGVPQVKSSYWLGHVYHMAATTAIKTRVRLIWPHAQAKNPRALYFV